MTPITQETPGLLPLPEDYEGRTLVLSAERLGARWQRAKFQLVKTSGGFGCKPDKIGSKVYGTHLADGEDAQFRRGDFIGEASPELIEAALADPENETPIDPTLRTYLAIGRGLSWGRGATMAEAKKACKRNGTPLYVFHCHPETHLTDMGMLQWPEACGAAVEVWRAKGVKS